LSSATDRIIEEKAAATLASLSYYQFPVRSPPFQYFLQSCQSFRLRVSFSLYLLFSVFEIPIFLAVFCEPLYDREERLSLLIFLSKETLFKLYLGFVLGF